MANQLDPMEKLRYQPFRAAKQQGPDRRPNKGADDSGDD